MSLLDETQLLTFGSVAQREALLRLAPDRDAQELLRQMRRDLDSSAVRGRSAAQAESSMAESVEELTDFLGVVGLVALLLGGVGVGSGVHAHIRRKVDTVAILRSLGATSGQVLALYVAQAALMGAVGAAIGAAAGVLVQMAIPLAASEFLPVDVNVVPVWSIVANGVLIGGWTALLFALLPLVGVRRISPLQTLRRDVAPAGEKRGTLDGARVAVALALMLSLAAVSVARTGSLSQGVVMAAGVVAALAVLALVSIGLSGAARRMLRRGWPYTARQGVANLYRPGNQTRAVLLSLGFGAFLIAALYLIQVNVMHQIELVSRASRGNVLLFDIQEDQASSVDSILAAAGAQRVELTPIVTMRIGSINGRPMRELLADPQRGGPGWALRREYRSSFADSVADPSSIVAGRQFGQVNLPPGFAEVSFEAEVADALHLAVNDTVVWNVQGVDVATVVTSLRYVDWGRLETNFFAVFGPGSIQQAPRTYALLARVDETQVPLLQGRIVDRHANVSAIDLSLVRQTMLAVQEKASTAVSFTTIFSVLMALPVLLSAVAATRRERVREGVLLRALGATRSQIRTIVLWEYAILGALGAATGVLLGVAGAWGVMWYVFEERSLALSANVLLAAVLITAVAALVGVATGRDSYRTAPAEALRN
jgi:putative ABC transport system permease protein